MYVYIYIYSVCVCMCIYKKSDLGEKAGELALLALERPVLKDCPEQIPHPSRLRPLLRCII